MKIRLMDAQIFFFMEAKILRWIMFGIVNAWIKTIIATGVYLSVALLLLRSIILDGEMRLLRTENKNLPNVYEFDRVYYDNK